MNINFLRFFHDRKRRRDVIFNIMRPHLQGKVLEVGAGDCNLIERINSENDLEGHGIDVKDYNQNLDFQNFQVYDGRSLPYPDGHFDTVMAVYVVHHIRDQLTTLGDMVRVLKPGGTLILLEDSFLGFAGRKLAELYDFLTNVGAFQVGREYTFHTPDGWKRILESELALKIKDSIRLRLGPLCQIVSPSLYFKLLIVAQKDAVETPSTGSVS
jgi:ubiquinone/menaquinone biosynthesis C-methylase UbiE